MPCLGYRQALPLAQGKKCQGIHALWRQMHISALKALMPSIKNPLERPRRLRWVGPEEHAMACGMACSPLAPLAQVRVLLEGTGGKGARAPRGLWAPERMDPPRPGPWGTSTAPARQRSTPPERRLLDTTRPGAHTPQPGYQPPRWPPRFNNAARPNSANTPAATPCTSRMGILAAKRSPTNTAGTSATSMPTVVPATTASGAP